ncbi:hypothetical protein ATANTOWER_009788 [Ataeniobius toweri]|uniref:Uncharacterized protein n=1 Tax=Ataeniobius toweri TaxID=208326 RepID=A0ABU7B8C9_9TELE|nr:hypothetical protein [Ataeniobius toweri]
MFKNFKYHTRQTAGQKSKDRRPYSEETSLKHQRRNSIIWRTSWLLMTNHLWHTTRVTGSKLSQIAEQSTKTEGSRPEGEIRALVEVTFPIIKYKKFSHAAAGESSMQSVCVGN